MLIRPGARPSPPTMRERARPAPIKGMNTADMVTAIGDGYAQRLDNLIARPDGLHVRNGYTVVSTAGSAVQSLLAAPGAVLAMTDGDWLGDIIANPGGRHLIAAKEGGTVPRRWAGSWTDCVITGVDTSKLRAPVEHGRRIMFVEQGTLTIWYLGLDAIGGPAQPIYLGPKCKQGGALVALASMGDQLVAVTDQGELLVYLGIDPDDAKTWRHAGTYTVSRPVGRRCFADSGAGLNLLTVDGIYPVPRILAAPTSGKQVIAITEKIAPDVAPLAPVAIVESGAAGVTLMHGAGVQYVRDGETGGWSRFVGLGATCWVEGHDGLYFGRADGKLCRYEGYEDGDAPIASILIDAFSRFGHQGRKGFRRMRPHFRQAHPYRARIELLTDHKAPPATWAATHTLTNYWLWPEVSWPMQPAQWSRPITARLGQWRGISGNGHAAAMILGMTTRDHDVTYIGADYAFEAGGSY